MNTKGSVQISLVSDDRMRKSYSFFRRCDNGKLEAMFDLKVMDEQLKAMCEEFLDRVIGYLEAKR